MSTHPLRFDEEFAQTYPIATLNKSIAQVIENNPTLNFIDSWDDLDYLKYCILDIFPGSKVALICHERSPVVGVDICIDPRENNFSRLLVLTLCNIGMTAQDLLWIHPDHLMKLQAEWGFQSESGIKQLC
jgi:hypothetical protein